MSGEQRPPAPGDEERYVQGSAGAPEVPGRQPGPDAPAPKQPPTEPTSGRAGRFLKIPKIPGKGASSGGPSRPGRSAGDGTGAGPGALEPGRQGRGQRVPKLQRASQDGGAGGPAGGPQGRETSDAAGEDERRESAGSRATKKAAGKAGKAIGNKVAPGIGGKIGEAVGTKAAVVVISVLPVLLLGFLLLPLMLQGSDGLGGFAQPGTVIPAAEPGGEPDAIQRDIPQDYLDTYLEAAARVGVPWPVLAAVGKAATDHGRFSPYDDACPLRDPLRSAELARGALESRMQPLLSARDEAQGELSASQAAVAAARSDLTSASGDAEGDARLLLEAAQARLDAAQRRLGEVQEQLLMLELRVTELSIVSETLGTSHLPCLRDRDPDRPANLPEGSELLTVPVWDFVRAGEAAGQEVPAPPEFRFDMFWGRWVRDWDDELDGADRSVFGPDAAQEVAAFDGPMMLAAGVIADPNRSRTSLSDAVFALAEQVLDARIALEPGLDSSLVSWQVDAAAADSVWGQVFDVLQVATLLDEPGVGCPFDPSAPTEALIEAIWRCELSGRTLSVIYDVVLSGGVVVSYSQVPASSAVEALVSEALRVAAGFSKMGSVRCDPSAAVAGVFPLSAAQAAAAGVDRCDRAGNITAAARIVAAGEETLPALRGGAGRYDALAGGWDAIDGALGDSAVRAAFAASGPAAAALSAPACRQDAAAWAQATLTAADSPISAAWLAAQPADALERVAAWDRSLFDGGRCAPLDGAVAAELSRRALSELDSDRMYSNLLTTLGADLLALRVSLHTAALPAPGQQEAVWGRDSFVPRLSHQLRSWPQVQATPPAASRDGLELSYLAVPMAVRYGGTVPEDERVGTWLLTAGALWSASMSLLDATDIDALLAALAELGGDPAAVSPLALSEAADVSPAVAVRFLSEYRELLEELGRAPTARELFDVLYQAPAAGANGLVCPVDGARPGSRPGFINDWQFCRGENCSRRHEGNDIFAPTGTPVRAVADATVVRVRCPGCASLGRGWGDYSALGGITVTYRTDNGWEWYNAHLHSIGQGIAPGVRVAQGAVVGTVGRTGNARNTPPHNHLGLFIGGRPTNPFPVTSIACSR